MGRAAAWWTAFVSTRSEWATLSDQEVATAGPRLLSIHHVGTAYGAYVDGALLAMRYVGDDERSRGRVGRRTRRRAARL